MEGIFDDGRPGGRGKLYRSYSANRRRRFRARENRQAATRARQLDVVYVYVLCNFAYRPRLRDPLDRCLFPPRVRARTFEHVAQGDFEFGHYIIAQIYTYIYIYVDVKRENIAIITLLLLFVCIVSTRKFGENHIREIFTDDKISKKLEKNKNF